MHREPIPDLPPCYGAFPETSPVRLQATAALAGASAGPFRRILVLECGAGVGPAALAAALAGGEHEIWAATPDPEDAAIARALSEESGAEVRVLTSGFRDLSERDDLPVFDLVALPWGWDDASVEDRAALVGLLASRVGPGGGFLRNASLADAAGESFMRRLAANRWASAPAGLEGAERVRWTLEAMARMFPQSHNTVRLVPDWKTRLAKLQALPPRTFARMWAGPPPPTETMRETGAALSRAGFDGWIPADAMRLAPDLDLAEAQGVLVDEAQDPWLAAETADLLMNRSRRVDLFLKPGGAAPDPGALRLALAREVADEAIEVRGLLGPATLSRAAYAPLIEALRKGGAPTLAELSERLGERTEALVERTAVLVGAGLVQPRAWATEADAPDQARAACRRLTEALWKRGITSVAACPLAGGPIRLRDG